MGLLRLALTSRRALVGLLAAAVLVAGCHRGWKVRAKVVDAKGMPIPDATAKFRCGPSAALAGPIGNFVTKDDGVFEAAGGTDTDPGASCSLEVVASGHKTATFGVGETCYRSSAAGNLSEPCPDAKLVVP